VVEIRRNVVAMEEAIDSMPLVRAWLLLFVQSGYLATDNLTSAFTRRRHLGPLQQRVPLCMERSAFSSWRSLFGA
jgi:hypothetical protein